MANLRVPGIELENYGSEVELVRKGSSQPPLEPNDVRVASRSKYLQGWRRHLVSLSSIIAIFLVNSEVAVVGTALISIVEDLHGVERMGWVITGYLITYTATVIIWAKLSDIFGRKYTLATCLLIFTAFSGACGASQTMNQLIISRVFQGIGAAGCWSIGLTIGYELVPPELHPIQGATIASAATLGSLVGPLIGGAAGDHGQWRWAFLFNVPAGIVNILLLLGAVPNQFPHQGEVGYVSPTWRTKLSRKSLARLDVSGSFLILGATMLIVAVLLEGGVSIAWDSGASIALFIVSGILWVLFLVNEWFFTKRDGTLEPIFPWRFLGNRHWMGVLLLMFISGMPYYVLIVNIPQRFQDLQGASAMAAAVRLIPFSIFVSLASALVNIFAMKTGIPIIWILLFGSVIQLAGLTWFCLLPDNGTLPSTIYACQILTGFGVGCVVGLSLLVTPMVVEGRDTAVSSGALIQVRSLGGVVGLSITTTASNNYLKTHLSKILGNLSTSAILAAVQEAKHLPLDQQREIRTELSKSYRLQSVILVAFGALQVLVVATLYRKGNQFKASPAIKA